MTARLIASPDSPTDMGSVSYMAHTNAVSYTMRQMRTLTPRADGGVARARPLQASLRRRQFPCRRWDQVDTPVAHEERLVLG